MTQYRWGKDTARKPWHRLRPVDSPDWHVLNSIATVYTTTDGGKRLVRASYRWHSTGNEQESWAVFGSVPAAKRWCEQQLAKFWEAPEITK